MEGLFLEGLLLQAGLIFALGAQNLFVLESGVRKQYPLTISFVCFLCDLLLIMLGVAGSASILGQFPQVKVLVGLIGVAFLFSYGLSKLNSGLSPFEEKSQLEDVGNLKRSVILAMTFSLLNPHAYLDAFILIGGYSMKYGDLHQRVALGLGSACFSLIWFLLLSSASSLIRPFLKNPVIMRKLLCTAGLALIILSGKLGLDVLHWMNLDLHLEQHFMSSVTYPTVGKYFTAILY